MDKTYDYDLFEKHELRFKNGKFRILTFSDAHVLIPLDKRVARDISAIVRGTMPDIVLFLGDQVWGSAADTPEHIEQALHLLVDPVEELGIPWAHVFGNHDDEKGISNLRQMQVYEKFRCCLTKRGPEDIHGVGNYVLPVYSEDGSDIVYNIWGIDSNDSLHADFIPEYGLEPDPWFYRLPEPMHAGGGYDCIRFDQIMWYWNTSKKIEAIAGHKVPGVMCFHIALPEYTIPYKNTAQTRYKGTMRESIGNSMINSGMYNACVERGDVKTMIAAHDHVNDWEGSYFGIKMTYDGGIGYDGYQDGDLRGGRVVDVSENDPWNVNTYMVRSSDYVEGYIPENSGGR